MSMIEMRGINAMNLLIIIKQLGSVSHNKKNRLFDLYVPAFLRPVLHVQSVHAFSICLHKRA